MVIPPTVSFKTKSILPPIHADARRESQDDFKKNQYLGLNQDPGFSQVLISRLEAPTSGGVHPPFSAVNTVFESKNEICLTAYTRRIRRESQDDFKKANIWG
jgi:predicted transcriptional regulator